MSKIEKLTPEQEAKIPQYVEMGCQIGFSTTPMNHDKAQEYAKKLYHFLKRPNTNPQVIFADGPLHAWKCVEDVTEQKNTSFIWPYLDGQFWSHYVAWLNFYRDVVNIKIDVDTSIIEELVFFGNVYPLENHCIIAEKLSVCKMNPSGIHCDGGPAVQYKDGSTLYALNGVIVPDWLALTPHHKLDPKTFATLTNAEVRREFIRKVGVERISLEMGAKILDKSTDNQYELLEINLGGRTGSWPYLKMLNPSIGVWHMECVDKKCKTIKDALTFRNKSSIEPEIVT